VTHGPPFTPYPPCPKPWNIYRTATLIKLHLRSSSANTDNRLFLGVYIYHTIVSTDMLCVLRVFFSVMWPLAPNSWRRQQSRHGGKRGTCPRGGPGGTKKAAGGVTGSPFQRSFQWEEINSTPCEQKQGGEWTRRRLTRECTSTASVFQTQKRVSHHLFRRCHHIFTRMSISLSCRLFN